MTTWTQRSCPEPGLRMQTAGGDRMVLTQHDVPVLLARVAADRCDVEYLRTDLYRSPVPPVTAAQSRRRPPSGTEGWAEHFRAGLTETAGGPLRDGEWALLPAEVAVPGPVGPFGRFGPDAVPGDAGGTLDWFSSDVRLLPLQPVPGAAASRVKALRKLAAEGALPPVLTWWVTGLQALVVLDGLARLAAAHAEQVPLAVLTLVEVDPARVDAGVEASVADYTSRTHGIRRLTGERAGLAHAHLARRLAASLDVALTDGVTRAWPLPGGVTQWQELVAAHGWAESL